MGTIKSNLGVPAMIDKMKRSEKIIQEQVDELLAQLTSNAPALRRFQM